MSWQVLLSVLSEKTVGKPSTVELSVSMRFRYPQPDKKGRLSYMHTWNYFYIRICPFVYTGIAGIFGGV